MGRVGEPTELIAKYGVETVKLLWDSVDKETVQWFRGLDFGFFELDCLLIHGSSVSVSDELTPQTSPLQMLDRLKRMEANHLFCGRSGQVFEYALENAALKSETITLDYQEPPTAIPFQPRRVIGVGNVGQKLGIATYTLYDPDTNQVDFKTIRYGPSKGF